MKKANIFFSIICILGLLLPALAETNFYDQVSQMWLEGKKAEVYTIATNRLAADTNDIAGLVLKMEYELEFLQLENLTNTMQRVVSVGGSISTTNFVVVYSKLQGELAVMQAAIPVYPADELAQDQNKSSITNKPMTYGNIIRAIEEDGLLDE